MCLTGNDKGFTPNQDLDRGFTFIEVMETVAVLAIGIVFIFQAFFINLDAFNSYITHLNGQRIINNKIWEIEQSLGNIQSLALEKPPNILIHNKEFSWEISLFPIGAKDLYMADVTLSSQFGSRGIKISRTAYVTRYIMENE